VPNPKTKKIKNQKRTAKTYKPLPAGGKKTASPQKETSAEIKKKVDLILKRGRERGFITYSEILYYFPNIEEDIFLLEVLYDQLEKENIQVLESKEFIEERYFKMLN